MNFTKNITALPFYLLAKLGRSLRSIVYLTLILVISSCAPRSATHGNIPSDDKLSKVSIGVHKRADIKSILGEPSTIGTFEDSVWYYIGRRTEQYAFFKEKIIEQKVVVIIFSDKGIVDQVRLFNQDDLREFSLVERTTPTVGHKLGFIEQVLGNMGRFNK